MNSLNRTLITILVSVLTLSVLFWYRKTSRNKPLMNTIIVGTSADFPPFSFRDKDNNITGFDIDVIKEVAKRIGLDIDIQDRPFSTLLPQMKLGQIHVIAAGMTPTPERAKSVDFTKPYLSNNPLLVISLSKNPPVTSLDNLQGKDVIVNNGYTADLYMSKLPGINLIRLPKVADAFGALDQGRAYAFVTAAFTLKPYIKELDKNKDKYKFFTIENTEETSALAISKQLAPTYLPKIQQALDDMASDGMLQSLKNKWEVI